MLAKKDAYTKAIECQRDMVREHVMGVIDSVITNRLELTKVCNINVNSEFYKDMSLDIKKIFNFAIKDYFS